ncbi:cyclophilin-like domain-containing protein [Boletus reticuloceps]|uniref:Peptidyl-prolyl cis-trans isomerase n=1 Tax=Boletus reticuloceps TaxID=495285 RepID=A0A8I2YZ84_9AGAM|nr:cyclophilin-like domain-containing protein [Boletus reticuloceps]
MPRVPYVFFDIQVDGRNAGRIVFKLYDDVVLKTAKNFRELATGKHGFGYQGSLFHRIIPNFMLRCAQNKRREVPAPRAVTLPKGTARAFDGDCVPTLRVWSTEISHHDGYLDENFQLKHTKPGLLSMANSDPNTNGSQFFITTVATSRLDGVHVVFGEVAEGFDVVKAVEKIGSLSGKPGATVKISKSGTVLDRSCSPSRLIAGSSGTN